ncbi:HER200Cp [Eremothecium sinecaudum]|uniref:HER200Cp n=1 Tax=Eremothecium sinecaudum TaxID=45286 RepID=A0A109UZR8_9SACH|nr:HER200Cp [Eremothecium sinecaudum]AMD21478.1 HER200Cp [Eremothecium sinecaudum]
MFRALNRIASRARIIRGFQSTPQYSFRSFSLYNGTGSAAKSKRGSLKQLVQTYGWSALGVYLALAAIDFPFCYIAVHSLGERTIKVYINKVKNLVGYGVDEKEVLEQIERNRVQNELDREAAQVSGKSAWERLKTSHLLTELILAYGIHKSLIFIRVPLVAAITPGIVRVLRKWGFNIGKVNK